MISLQKILTITVDNAEEIIKGIKQGNEKTVPFGLEVLTLLQVYRQYDPNWHDIHDINKRNNRFIEVPVIDNGAFLNAEDYQNQSQNPQTRPEIIFTNRISVPMQKLIVTRAVAFLTGNGLSYDCSPANDKETAMFQGVQRVNDINKMEYNNVTIATMLASETHCAELWYIVDNSVPDTDGDDDDNDDFEGIAINTRNLTLRCKIIGHSLGDELYPVFDSMGDMVAFMRKYTQFNEEGEKINTTEIYTEKVTFILNDTSGAGTYSLETKVNLIGKIPVIYYSQPAPEWLDVQHDIKRYEDLISN